MIRDRPEGGPERRAHQAALEALGLGPRARERLERYLGQVARWSVRINLTAARTAGERVRLLVGPVLSAVDLPPAGRLIDVGSGNGSPGLVLALLRDDLDVVLLEPRARRWAFLREAARAAGRAGVEVLRQRHDQYDGPPAPTLTLRALALPLAALAPLVEGGGRALVFGGDPRPEAPFRLEEKRALGLGSLHVFRREG